MRLLLKISQDDGYESVVPFVYESKEKAVEDLKNAYNVAEEARVKFRLMYAEVCKPRDALFSQRKQYEIGKEPQDLMDAIAAQMKITDLRNYKQPDGRVQFANLDLTLDDFKTNRDGFINFSMPEVVTLDEFFAEVE